PRTGSSVSRFGSTRAICCPTAKCRLKWLLLAMKSVVRVAHRAVSVPTVVVPVVAVAVVADPRLLRRLKENNHAATITQKVSQRAQGPEHWPGNSWRAGLVR